MMNILAIDRDEITVQMLRAKLEDKGHKIIHEPNKDNVSECLKSNDFDIILIDPSPLKTAQNIIINIRREAQKNVYIILLSENPSLEEAIKSGANDYLQKPIAGDYLDEAIKNADYLLKLMARIGDTNEDFPSAGGVIAKSAYNQLFLSALDRADRYGERTYTLFISIKNYQEILELDGAYAADYASASLSKTLARIRRQSDIIAQTAKYEYALLLQRPIYDTEPVEAANRFAAALSEATHELTSGPAPVELNICLTELPSGKRAVEHHIKPNKD